MWRAWHVAEGLGSATVTLPQHPDATGDDVGCGVINIYRLGSLVAKR